MTRGNSLFDRREHPSEERGIASMLEFAMAVVILSGAMLLAVTVLATNGASTANDDTAPQQIGFRGADALSDDLLVPTANEPGIDHECADAYFSSETDTGQAGRCGFDQALDSSPHDFVRSTLGVAPQYNANVTLRADGSVVETDLDDDGTPTRFALGPEPARPDRVSIGVRKTVFGDDVLPQDDPDVVEIHVTVWRDYGQ
ncbi:hypothetical protein RYH80_18670 [Halobaculum sp. MBLA0147]|uniref:DUF7287 family protein n=1 Tax=Halobaculum sp. MBLA0147 TaxID=3079934 RepID=UPI0035241484